LCSSHTLTPVYGRMVDRYGRRVEVILLDRCDGHGPRQWIRVSWHHNIRLGRGYYRSAELDDALALVDVESLVEVIELRPLDHTPQPVGVSGRRHRVRRSAPIGTHR
jgi:hypothetical protein